MHVYGKDTNRRCKLARNIVMLIKDIRFELLHTLAALPSWPLPAFTTRIRWKCGALLRVRGRELEMALILSGREDGTYDPVGLMRKLGALDPNTVAAPAGPSCHIYIYKPQSCKIRNCLASQHWSGSSDSELKVRLHTLITIQCAQRHVISVRGTPAAIYCTCTFSSPTLFKAFPRVW